MFTQINFGKKVEKKTLILLHIHYTMVAENFGMCTWEEMKQLNIIYGKNIFYPLRLKRKAIKKTLLHFQKKFLKISLIGNTNTAVFISPFFLFEKR